MAAPHPDGPGLPTERPCAGCGATWAAHGYARRNHRKLPLEKQTVVWVCGKPECKARAADWKARADAEMDPTAARAARKPLEPPAQAALI